MLLAVTSNAKRGHGWIALLRMIADTVVDSLAGRADVLSKEWELLNDVGVHLGLTPFHMSQQVVDGDVAGPRSPGVALHGCGVTAVWTPVTDGGK
jgi:hypothetical protein